MEKRQTMLALAAVGAVIVLVYLMKSSSSSAAAGTASILDGVSNSASGYPTDTWSATGTVNVSPPVINVADPAVITPVVDVPTKPAVSPAASTAFVTGGGNGTDHGPVYDPVSGGQISFGSSSTLTGDALLMHNYGWTQAQLDSFKSNPINAGQW
jgi:hypothetical protein